MKFWKLKGSLFCVNHRTGHDLHRGADARKVAEWVLKHRPRVAWFRTPCCCWDGCNNEQMLSGRRNYRRLICNCVALMRILGCVGTEILWVWLQTHWGGGERSDQSVSQVLTLSPHHVRIDGCVCGLRESVNGDLF